MRTIATPCLVLGYRDLKYRSYRNNQQDATVYQNLLFFVNMMLNMFRATHRSSSGAQELH